MGKHQNIIRWKIECRCVVNLIALASKGDYQVRTKIISIIERCKYG
jgi:hypothetical protein